MKYFEPVCARCALVLSVVIFQVSGCSFNSESKSRVAYSPMIVAHRGGAADFPENTLLAIDNALRNHVDMLWLTVQLSSDGVPVLYRPADLSANTQGQGTVAEHTWGKLQKLNPGWHFKHADEVSQKVYPYRDQTLSLPSLQQALAVIPTSIPIILDMKALPAVPQVKAVVRILEENHAWNRVMIYSTDASYQEAFVQYPKARLFESRDTTRDRLASVALAERCQPTPLPGSWVAFEYQRKFEVVEKFTLGNARSFVNSKPWTRRSIDCFQSKGKLKILAIGINSVESYRAVACLKVDAILVDSPKLARAMKQRFAQLLKCD
ncbi:glycerophosphodiester phosphodiesterase family protein [Pseudomonas protegens]